MECTCRRLVGVIRGSGSISASVSGGTSISAVISAKGGSSATYDGPYEAIPTWDEQTFRTKGYGMKDDFIVDRIIKQEVRNDAGGLTLTI